MLIRPAELEAIRCGDVDLAFRRWDRPRLRVGTRMRTSVGLVEVTSVDPVSPDEIDEEAVRRAGAASLEVLMKLLSGQPERPIYRIGLRFAGADPRISLRENAELTASERADLLARLDRLDRSSPRGPWTRATLALIEANPARRAPDLAQEMGRDTPTFKRDVRKLKELGLTESLDVGYRISPRGHALIHP